MVSSEGSTPSTGEGSVEHGSGSDENLGPRPGAVQRSTAIERQSGVVVRSSGGALTSSEYEPAAGVRRRRPPTESATTPYRRSRRRRAARHGAVGGDAMPPAPLRFGGFVDYGGLVRAGRRRHSARPNGHGSVIRTPHPGRSRIMSSHMRFRWWRVTLSCCGPIATSTRSPTGVARRAAIRPAPRPSRSERNSRRTPPGPNRRWRRCASSPAFWRRRWPRSPSPSPAARCRNRPSGRYSLGREGSPNAASSRIHPV